MINQSWQDNDNIFSLEDLLNEINAKNLESPSDFRTTCFINDIFDASLFHNIFLEEKDIKLYSTDGRRNKITKKIRS